MNPIAQNMYANYGVWGIIIFLIVSYSGFMMWFLCRVMKEHKGEREKFISTLNELSLDIRNHDSSSKAFREENLRQLRELTTLTHKVVEYVSLMTGLLKEKIKSA